MKQNSTPSRKKLQPIKKALSTFESLHFVICATSKLKQKHGPKIETIDNAPYSIWNRKNKASDQGQSKRRSSIRLRRLRLPPAGMVYQGETEIELVGRLCKIKYREN